MKSSFLFIFLLSTLMIHKINADEETTTPSQEPEPSPSPQPSPSEASSEAVREESVTKNEETIATIITVTEPQIESTTPITDSKTSTKPGFKESYMKFRKNVKAKAKSNSNV